MRLTFLRGGLSSIDQPAPPCVVRMDLVCFSGTVENGPPFVVPAEEPAAQVSNRRGAALVRTLLQACRQDRAAVADGAVEDHIFVADEGIMS